jgi:dihydropteroate synthase-like protein
VNSQHLHFVTGRLAEHSLRRVLAELADAEGFDYSVDVLPITVAALMTPAWIAARIDAPTAAERIIVPGYCEGELSLIEQATGKPVERGPRDLRRLPQHLGAPARDEAYGRYDIQILAEINHAPRLPLAEILAEAARLSADGAELIDVGCNPGETWSDVAETVAALRDAGHRVSIDSLNPAEIEAAARAGAELVLSVNSSNRHAAADWGCEVVAIPDVPATLEGLDATIEMLAAAGVPLRIDPVLEPIGFGFAASLGRYLEIRRRYPDAEIMMGVGNLTELTDVDSAGVNVLLLGICQEVGIRSVLTTQVINWARSSVRECDLARRLVYHAVMQQTLPKHIEPRLVMLRDEEVIEQTAADLLELSQQVRDNNYRIFAAEGAIHLVSGGLHLQASDPFALFEELLASEPKNLDAGHAFYLGFEMCKALTALTLDKQYQQDESLDWGLLTDQENFHRLKRAKGGRQP